MELHAKIDRGVPLLDVVVPKYLELQKITFAKAEGVFHTMFAGLDYWLIDHLVDAWQGKKKAFDEFYLNLDHRCDRKVLEYWGIEVEADTLPETDSPEHAKDRMLRIMNAADRFDIFPFETYLVHKFLQLAYNASLDEAKDWGMTALLKASRVKRYGNGTNWGKFYLYLLQHDCLKERRQLVEQAVTRNK